MTLHEICGEFLTNGECICLWCAVCMVDKGTITCYAVVGCITCGTHLRSGMGVCHKWRFVGIM